MALQLSYSTDMGFTAPLAYAHITNFTGTKAGVRVNVELHYDKAARDAGLKPIQVQTINLPVANGATLIQMYDALKTIIVFTGAVDA